MDGWIKIGTKLDTKSFDKEIEELEDKIRYLENRKRRFIADDDVQSLREVNTQLEKTKNKLIGLQQQQMKLGNTSKQSFIKMQDGMEGVIKKVIKWGLAIFSVRSAYSIVRRAMSSLTQYDENLQAQLDYISWTIANAIAPVVNKIVNLVYQILQYVNQIIENLFGFTLFKGVDDFEQSMKNASGSAKEIKKAMAGFDEKNVIAITQASSGGASTTKPKFTGSELKTPKWLEWIFRNGDRVKMILEGIATAILMSKFNLDLIQGLGIWFILDGARRTIEDIKDYLDDPTWGNFNQILIDIGETLGGIFLLFKGSTLGTISGWLLVVVALIWNISEYIKGLKKSFESPTWKNFWDTFNAGTTILGPLGAGLTIIIYLFGQLKDKIGGAYQKLKDFNKEMKQTINQEKYPNMSITGQIAEYGGMKLGSWLKSKLGLAKGTILNNPGQGVPLSNVVAGEQGREALIPLSDSQLLEELGSTIGRYVSINLTNITELDGSTIARKVSKINQENNFARNR